MAKAPSTPRVRTYRERRRRGFFLCAESRPRESEQDDKWNFCLTAGTLCLANQERR
jgi:hypothetical protein